MSYKTDYEYFKNFNNGRQASDLKSADVILEQSLSVPI